MADDSQVRSDCLQLYLCIQGPCSRRVVSLKIRTMDASTRELNGPGLARGLRELVAEKDLGERVIAFASFPHLQPPLWLTLISVGSGQADLWRGVRLCRPLGQGAGNLAAGG